MWATKEDGMLKRIAAVVLALLVVNSSQASLTIAFDFSAGTEPRTDVVLAPENQAIFNSAAAFWETAITGYADGASRTVTINATAFDEGPVGGGITLGFAGPTTATSFLAGGTGFTTAATGIASFNINSAAVGAPAAGNTQGLLNELTIRHEIGHILGIGTLWDFGFNDLYDDGTGQYFGANGLAAYQNEFDPSATFVPVELDGGPGTENGHWNEVNDNFAVENEPGFDSDPGDDVAAPTVRFGPNAGLSLDDELLSGVLSGSAFLSDTSLGAFQDLGFTTIPFQAIAVPEPGSAVVLLLTCVGVTLRRRRQR